MADFQLIDLSSNIAFTFQYFPNEIRSVDRANWQPQDTTAGVKPLFYGNGEPRGMSVNELILDNTDTGRSLTPDLGDLRALKDEVDGIGTPPPLLAVWGDQQLRCVLQDLTIEEIFFNDDGGPTRVRIGIELLQLQPDGEGTSVKPVESTYTEDIF